MFQVRLASVNSFCNIIFYVLFILKISNVYCSWAVALFRSWWIKPLRIISPGVIICVANQILGELSGRFGQWHQLHLTISNCVISLFAGFPLVLINNSYSLSTLGSIFWSGVKLLIFGSCLNAFATSSIT